MSLGDLSDDCQRFIQPNSTSSNAISQRRAVDEFENQSANATGFLEAVNARNIRMIQRCKHLRFTLETPDPIGIECERLRQHLHRDVA